MTDFKHYISIRSTDIFTKIHFVLYRHAFKYVLLHTKLPNVGKRIDDCSRNDFNNLNCLELFWIVSHFFNAVTGSVNHILIMSIDVNIDSNKNSYNFRMHNKKSIAADKGNIGYFQEKL